MHREINRDLSPKISQFDKEKNYWMKKFSGELVKSRFPYDHGEMGAEAFTGSELEFKIPADLFFKLNHLTNRSDHNLFVIFSAVLTLLLSRYTGNNDIVIGTPILKQEIEIEGEFLNTLLPLRNRLSPGMTFKELLVQVKKTFKEANDNSNYPLQRLLHHLGLPGVENGFPLFETVILLENIQSRTYIEKRNHNLVFCFHRTDQCIEGVLGYNSVLYRKETLERITSLLVNLLENSVKDLNLPVSDIEMLSEKERHQLLVAFNDTRTRFPGDKPWHELFENQVKKNHGNLAVAAGDDHFSGVAALTYAQLNEKSNQLARLLVQKGVGPDTIAAIMTAPSLEMAVGIMAISKAGGAYLPIDHESPGDRMEYLLTESHCSILLSQGFLRENVNFKGEIINLDDQGLYTGENSNLEKIGSPMDLFYTIYTSGTTGRPKGALLTHRNLVNYVTWFSKTAYLTDKDKTILTSSFAFDLGYSTFLGALLTGGQLHIIPKETYINSELLLDYIKEKGISYLKMTPSLFSVIVKDPAFSKETCSTLRLVVLGGEEINTRDLERAHQVCSHIKIMNHYGPTEATIGSVARFIDFNHYEEYKKNPTIGKPIHNTGVYILDKHLQPVPTGIPGELFIGGDGVARGYLNNPELTAEKFRRNVISHSSLVISKKSFVNSHLSLVKNKLPKITNDHSNMLFTNDQCPMTNDRFYKTGDLARWLPEGNIQFLGRKDNQMKIRGFRIELGEIENQILKKPGVKEVVVLAMEDNSGGKFLCAYVVPAPGENTVDINALKEFLSNNLPDFMIPPYFVSIDKIPLTPNGKVDKKALIKIEIPWGSNEYTPPENEPQAKMIEIWSQVLEKEIDKIGIHTNFFELGGHSLKVMLLVSRIHKEFNAKISMVEVFSYPTAAELTKYIKEKETKERYRAIEPKEAKEYYALSSPQRRFYLAQQLNPGNMAYHMPGTFVLAPGFNEEKLESIFKELIRRHESLRTSFKIINNEPFQIIHENVDIKIDFHNVQEQDAAKTIENFIRPFHLNTPPLFRLGLINTGREKILAVDMHHIISDGVSLQVLAREFSALARGRPLAPLPVQYKEYASWQNNLFQEKFYNKMGKYWLDTLENFKITRLPGDNPGKDGRGSNYENSLIEKNTYLKIEKFCTQHKITIFSFMLSVFFFILTKETGESDITLGIPVDNREHLDLENIIGVFLNVFLLRAKIHREDTIINNIFKINQAVIDALANSTYTYEELYYRLRDRYRLPNDELFTILFNYLPTDKEEENQGANSETVPLVPLEITPKYPVTIYIKDSGEKLSLDIVYRDDLYNKNRIKRMIHNYSRFIEIIITRQDTMVSGLVYEDVEKDDSLKEFGEEFENEDLF